MEPSGAPQISPQARHLSVAAAFALSFAAYLWHASRYFPNRDGLIGADYSWFLPTLLAGHFWFMRNGIFHIPYFTPAFCGGMPLLANPQSVIFSLPQLPLTILDPVQSILATLVVFALAGALGTYLLSVRCFRSSVEAGVLAASLFLMNGFLLHRMAIGHLTYHVFGLVPVLTWLVVRTHRSLNTYEGTAPGAWLVLSSVGGGLILSYVSYGGGLNFQLPVVLTAASSLLLLQLRLGTDHRPWLVLGASGGWGLLLSAAKLVPAVVVTSQYSRTYLPHYLFHNPADELAILAKGLFLPSLLPWTVRFSSGAVLERHEFELGLSIVPLALICLASMRALRRRHQPFGLMTRSPGTVAMLLMIALVPLVLTFGPWQWGLFLLKVPVINNNTTFVRWWAIYLLPLIILAAACFDALVRHPDRRVVALAACLWVATAQQVLVGSPYYEAIGATYDPRAVVAAFDRSKRSEGVPSITRIVGPSSRERSAIAHSTGLNDGLVSGQSNWPCYEPLFGYRLELAPPLGLRSGSIEAASSTDLLNIVDPSAYFTFREGRTWRFPSSRKIEARRFAAYLPYDWAVPVWQTAATAVSLIAFSASIAYAGVFVGWALTRRILAGWRSTGK